VASTMMIGWEMKVTRPLFVPGMVLPRSPNPTCLGPINCGAFDVGTRVHPANASATRNSATRARTRLTAVRFQRWQEYLKAAPPSGLSETVMVPPKART